MVAFHANTTTYLQLTMQEVSSATTPALQQALWQQHSILPPRDRRRRRRLWPFRQPGLPFAEPSRRGSPRGVEWQEEGDRERARERERERREGRKSALLERLACCYFWLRWWYIVGRPLAAAAAFAAAARQEKQPFLFSVKLLCFLSHGGGRGRSDGQRSVAGSLSALSTRASERRAQRARNNDRL